MTMKFAAIALSSFVACSAAHSQTQSGTVGAAKAVAAEYMALIYHANENQLAFGEPEDNSGVLSIPVRVLAADKQTAMWDCHPTFVRNPDVAHGWQISNPRCAPAAGAVRAN